MRAAKRASRRPSYPTTRPLSRAVAKAERSFGLGKGALMGAPIPIAEGAPKAGGWGMGGISPGQRYVLTAYVDRIASDTCVSCCVRARCRANCASARS